MLRCSFFRNIQIVDKKFEIIHHLQPSFTKISRQVKSSLGITKYLIVVLMYTLCFALNIHTFRLLFTSTFYACAFFNNATTVTPIKIAGNRIRYVVTETISPQSPILAFNLSFWKKNRSTLSCYEPTYTYFSKFLLRVGIFTCICSVTIPTDSLDIFFRQIAIW